MAQERRKQLTASLEAKKRELGEANESNESGEFRLLVDNDGQQSKLVIAEAIGINYFLFCECFPGYGPYLSISSVYEYTRWQGYREHKKFLRLKREPASFAVENILEANEEKDCEQSPLKDFMNRCGFAELRPLTDEEKLRLDELNGEAFGLQWPLKCS